MSEKPPTMDELRERAEALGAALWTCDDQHGWRVLYVQGRHWPLAASYPYQHQYPDSVANAFRMAAAILDVLEKEAK